MVIDIAFALDSGSVIIVIAGDRPYAYLVFLFGMHIRHAKPLLD